MLSLPLRGPTHSLVPALQRLSVLASVRRLCPPPPVSGLRTPGQGASDDVLSAALRLVLSDSLRVIARRGPGTTGAGTGPSTGLLEGWLATTVTA